MDFPQIKRRYPNSLTRRFLIRADREAQDCMSLDTKTSPDQQAVKHQAPERPPEPFETAAAAGFPPGTANLRSKILDFSLPRRGRLLAAPWQGKRKLAHAAQEEGARKKQPDCAMASLHTKILDFRWSDSSRILILRDGIVMSIGDFPEYFESTILSRDNLSRDNLSRGIGRTAVFLIKDSENVARDPGQILDWQVFPEGMAATTSKS